MSDPKRCERCGGAFPEAGVLRGRCPRCMIELGLESGSGLRNFEAIPTGQEDTNVAARNRWQKIEIVFYEARELNGNDRVRFLDRACPDTAMRQQLDVLLRQDGTRDTFLASPAVEMLAATLLVSPGMFLASYEICELIGVGGVGEVYKARDTRLGRHVAKIGRAHV